MKLFTKRTPEEKAAKVDEKLQKYDAQARTKAAKSGFNTDGAVAVGWDFDDGRFEFLAVFPDRVEVFTKSVAPFATPESQVVPLSRVSSVRVERAGTQDKIIVTTSNAEIGVKVGMLISTRIRDAIISRIG